MSEPAHPEPEQRPRVPPQRGYARPMADFVPMLVAPSARKRGFATADLVALWGELVGSGYADCTRPEKLEWPRRAGRDGEDEYLPATLTVACSGARALLFQHEVPAIREAINRAFGFQAIGQIRLVQRVVEPARRRAAVRTRPLTPDEDAALAAQVQAIDNPDLRDALLRLGRAIRGRLPNP